ncbi:Aste57867_535 [Aphanomyces stellatus]|uniref:Aste57867_535 protein n=1 Tax=Aphanomyces stellatus TaxID=120398 RepID=A0A485K424_9STRA|nr:hypothetical protein As57867_000534 [Aphanomyces stellatus]VFT77760.1 Aste57867_535 [Aphanomyces stellatus]
MSVVVDLSKALHDLKSTLESHSHETQAKLAELSKPDFRTSLSLKPQLSLTSTTKRQLKLDESMGDWYRKTRPSSAATMSSSSTSSWDDRSPGLSPRRERRRSSVEFEDQSTQATLTKFLEALEQAKQQQDFVAQSIKSRPP